MVVACIGVVLQMMDRLEVCYLLSGTDWVDTRQSFTGINNVFCNINSGKIHMTENNNECLGFGVVLNIVR